MITADEKKICVALGVSEEEYIKARNSEISDGTSINSSKAINAEEKKICRLCGVSEEEYVKAKATEARSLRNL